MEIRECGVHVYMGDNTPAGGPVLAGRLFSSDSPGWVTCRVGEAPRELALEVSLAAHHPALWVEVLDRIGRTEDPLYLSLSLFAEGRPVLEAAEGRWSGDLSAAAALLGMTPEAAARLAFALERAPCPYTQRALLEEVFGLRLTWCEQEDMDEPEGLARRRDDRNYRAALEAQARVTLEWEEGPVEMPGDFLPFPGEDPRFLPDADIPGDLYFAPGCPPVFGMFALPEGFCPVTFAGDALVLWGRGCLWTADPLEIFARLPVEGELLGCRGDRLYLLRKEGPAVCRVRVE